MGGGSDTQTSTPWSSQIPYLQDIFSRSQGLADTPMNFFPTSTVAGRQAGNIEANQLSLDRGRRGFETLSAAEGNIQSTLAGDFLSPGSNPFLEDTASQAMRRFQEPVGSMKAMLDSKFAGRGRRMTDPGAMQAASKLDERIFQGNTDLLTNIYGGNYQQERGRQMQASQLAPAMAGAFQQEVGGLRGAGQDDQNYAQAQLNSLIERFNFGQQEPESRLDRYSSRINQSGVIPGKTVVQQGTGGSEIGSILGGVGGILAMLMGA